MKKNVPALIFLTALVLIVFVFAFSRLTSNSVESVPDGNGSAGENVNGKASSSVPEGSPAGKVVIPPQKTARGTIRNLDGDAVLGGRPVMPPQYRLTRPGGVKVETVADNLEIPWDMAFTRDGDRLFFTERPGRVKVVELSNGQAMVRLWLDRKDSTLHWGEGGLMGIALHPDFGSGKKDGQGKPPDWIYLSETYGSTVNPANRILRVRKVRDGNGSKFERQVLVEEIPAASYHNGSRLAFGPDGMLYATSGDAGRPELAQDLESWAGKILRLTPEGRPAPGNPFSGPGPKSYVYSYGHRNPQGLAWHPVTGDLYSSEHGPSGEFGLGGYDEINLIRKGGNYGWPKVVGAPGLKEFTDPILLFTDPHLPPAGMTFYSGSRIKNWMDSLIIGSLRGELLLRVELNYSGSAPAVSHIERLFEIKTYRGVFGRIRAVTQGPDGYLYFATSNRDGRGNPAADDDRIMRLVPE